MTKGLLWRNAICFVSLAIIWNCAGCATSKLPLRESEVPVWLEKGKPAPFSGLLIQEGAFAGLFEDAGRKILETAKGK